MKKVLCVLTALLCVFTFTGCKNNKKSTETIITHIIEERNNIFVGSDENYYATFCSGKRENPYSLDGVINNKVDFGIVTFFKNDNSSLKVNEVSFVVKINGEEKNGALEKSPFDNTYSADIGIGVDDNAEISLLVKVEGKEFSQNLFNESKNFVVSKTQALETAGKELKSIVSEMKDKDGKTAEAMVKILKDYSGETNKYFWYVGIISVDGKTAGVLIDTQTGEIVSKKL